MSSSFPVKPITSSTVSRPSITTQTSHNLPPFAADGRSSQFSSSFSIHAILNSSPTSPSANRFPPSTILYRQFLLAEDAGPVDYSQVPHHCCQHGACAVNWQTDVNNKGNANSKDRFKANKRSRTIFTPVQLEQLESTFTKQQYVAGEERRRLATSLKLTETHVKVWFQNRRIRFRKQANQQTDIA